MPKQKVKKGARTLGPEYKFNYAYIWYNGHVYKPGSTLRAPAGATLTARAWVRNTNNVSGTACYGVVWSNYYRCGPKTKDIDAGKSWVRMPDCTFSMPSSDKDAVLKCGSYEGGTCYTHDTTDAIRLRVEKDTELICKDADKTAVVGDTLDLEVKLKDKATGAGINGKWIEFYKLVDSSEVSIGSCTTDSNGECSITYTCNVAETATIKAKFEGDDEYNASECTFTISVSKKPTDLTCYNKSAKVGQSVDLEAKLEFGDYPYYPIEDEWIYFYVDGNYAGRDKTDANGIAKVSYTPSSAGTYTIKAEYRGSSQYYSSSCTATLTVTEEKKDTTLTCYDRSCEKDEWINLRATLKEKDYPYSGISGRTVKFYIDGNYVGSDTTDADGDAFINYKCTSPGTHTILCMFDGDETYNDSSCTATLQVTAPTPTPTPPELEITEVYYSTDNGTTFWGVTEGGTIDLGDCKRPLFKIIIKNTGGASDKRCLWLREGKGCSTENTIGIEASSITLGTDESEEFLLDCDVDMDYGKDYSFHIKDGQLTEGCPSDDEFDFKTKAPAPYEITITVKDEKGNGIKHAYVSVTKEIFEGTWQEVPCSDITVHRGVCTTESWKGYGNLLKTDDEGVLSIGLPSLPGAACRYGFIAGKPGYLNSDMHEDWTEVKTTRRQGENGEGEGTYEFEFTLKTAPKIIVHVTDVPTKGSCVFVYEKKLYIASSWWFPIPIAIKTLETDGAVTFAPDDKIEIGGEYAVKAAGASAKWPTWICLSSPPVKDEDWFTFKDTIEKTIKGYYEATPWQQWFCDLFDVSEKDCSAAWAGLPLELLFSPESWRRVLEGKDINGNPATPRWYDYVFMVLDCIGFIPLAKFSGLFGRGAKLAKVAAENSRVTDWIKTVGKDKLARAIAGAEDEDVKYLLSLLSNSKFDEASAWVTSLIKNPARVPKSDVVKGLTKSINTLLKKAAKKGQEGLRIAEKGGATAAHTKAASEIAADYTDEIVKLREFYKENVVWDDIVEMDRNLWLHLKDPELNKYLTSPIKGSEKIHPTGISLLDLWRVEALTKPRSVAKLKEAGRLDHFLEYAVKSIKADPGKFRKIVGALSDAEADTIVKELKAAHKPAEAGLYEALRTSDKWVKTGGLFEGVSDVSSKLMAPVVAGGETHKAAKSIVDDSIDFIEAVEKDAKIAESFEKADSPDKIPHARRLWDWIKNKASEAKLTWDEMTFKEKARFYLKYIFFYGCFGLFIGEEALQHIGFSLIPAWALLRGWEYKSLDEKKDALEILKFCVEARKSIHTLTFLRLATGVGHVISQNACTV